MLKGVLLPNFPRCGTSLFRFGTMYSSFALGAERILCRLFNKRSGDNEVKFLHA